MKKLISILLAIAMLGSVSSLAYSSVDFSGGSPSGITTDAESGDMLVTDVFNKVIWRVSGEEVTIAAGQIAPKDLSGEPTGLYEDATLLTALFTEPWDIVPFLNGYAVSDSTANVIRIVLSDKVQTLTGSEKEGNANGHGIKASFSHPTGLAVDENDNLYIADTGNDCIRVMSKKGDVTTWCAGLSEPTGICWKDGSLYVAESGRSRIVKITDGFVSPIAGTTETLDGDEYTFGYRDGKVKEARFNHPQGILVDDNGVIYIADTDNHAVRKIADGMVTTVKANKGEPSAPLSPRGMLLSGDTLYVCDTFARELMEVSLKEVKFNDVKDDAWYADKLYAAAERGFVSGTTSGNFVPTGLTTRAAFVSMLSNIQSTLDGSVVINGDSTFTDVKSGDWYESAVKWAADAGIVSGSNGKFSPLKTATREQLAVMLMNFANYLEIDTSKRADISSYPDASSVHSWATEAMQWAVAEGIFSGNAKGELLPLGDSTRAGTVCIIMNFMELIEK